jgi:hypothetical protein
MSEICGGEWKSHDRNTNHLQGHVGAILPTEPPMVPRIQRATHFARFHQTVPKRGGVTVVKLISYLLTGALGALGGFKVSCAIGHSLGFLPGSEHTVSKLAIAGKVGVPSHPTMHVWRRFGP